MIKKIITSFLFLTFSIQVFAADPDDLLSPDIAFKPTITLVSNDKIKATWDIADEYFMYRKRFKFESDTAGITLGEASIPDGKVKDDEFFGKVETYRNKIEIEIPIMRDASVSDATEFSLKTVSQGCADAGVCYPPQKETLNIGLNAVKVAAVSPNSPETMSAMAIADSDNATASSLASKLDLSGLSNNNNNKPVDPEVAFGFDITASDNKTLNARWDILEGHYLYQHKFKFKIVGENTGVTLGKPVLPKGKKEIDEYFGEVVTYNESINVKVPLLYSDTTKVDSITVKTSYQGCSKLTGICYPPQHKTETINVASAPITASNAIANSDDATKIDDSQTANKVSTDATDNSTVANNNAANNKVSEQDGLINKLTNGGFFQSLLIFFFAGLALTFTPCVFPMIPILSGIIAGQGSDNSTKKSFFLSLSYVLTMALTYAIVGVVAALSGENLQVALQNPWVIGSFAILFVLLSLSMFGFYELQMPASIQSKLTKISNGQNGGSMANAGIMGFLSALIVGPCVTAPLIAALVYIAQTKDVVLGGLSLFSLGLGMGVPLLIIGTSAGKILPRAGAWMDSVKAGFGIMMIAMAIWMLERILPFDIIVVLVGILTVFSAIYMGALDALTEAATGWKRFFKAAGLIFLIYGVTLLAGAFTGNGSLIKPLKGFTGGSIAQIAAEPQHLVFKKIKGLDDLDAALAMAKQNNQSVMLDFYADWCISCKEMEHNTFTDKAVIESLKDTLLIQADVTLDDEIDKALNKSFGLYGPPAILFFDKAGKESKPYRIVGYKGPKDFDSHIQQFKQTLN